MNDCEKYLRLIDDFVEGELDRQNAARVKAHVFACPTCRGQYEVLQREREIYARYLFDAEPPPDLWANFQAKLETEKTPSLVGTPAKASEPKTNPFGFSLRFPTLASVAALLVVFAIGSGWLKFESGNASEGKIVAETRPGDWQMPEKFVGDDKSKTMDLPAKTKSDESSIAPPNIKSGGKSESVKARNVFAAERKTSAAEAVKIAQKIVLSDVRKNSAEKNQPSEEEREQSARMKSLEKEIAGQIERVEMLLRSFRNARAVEGDKTFDVGFEREQARRLLEKNVRLRRDAENYGIASAEELLNRVEPYLLDIANLANNPQPDAVLDIRERVKNQSIIASLQIY